ncbi:MAG: beta-1,4-galactosyltransferase [Planctomycetes bacterium]|nr:beta-1,4-galactosyltransferase [Planctomycetota bacterium]
MIFVTVGTAAKGIEFTRLIEAMDRIAGDLGVDVLIQRGHSPYEPQHAREVRFLRYDEAVEMFRTCDFVVGHCGAGTVLNALRFNKPMILVPRRVDQGELDVDDHQMQLAREIESMEGVALVYDLAELKAAVRRYVESPPPGSSPTPERAPLIEAVREFLAALPGI